MTTSSQDWQQVNTKLGAAALGANLILSHAKTQADVHNEIKNNNVKAIIFQPTLPLGEELYIDVLNKLIPELANTKNGQKMQSKNYASLSTLIQTNFYSFPGVYKFRSILNYAQDKYFKVPTQEEFTPITLPDTSNTLFVTQPASDFGFRAAVLNSNVNGRYLVVVQGKDVNRIAEMHQNKVDLVATQEIPNLNSSINVIVQKGSSVYQNHAKRIEV